MIRALLRREKRAANAEAMRRSIEVFWSGRAGHLTFFGPHPESWHMGSPLGISVPEREEFLNRLAGIVP